MKFAKAAGHSIKDARVLVHTGVGLEHYRWDRTTSNLEHAVDLFLCRRTPRRSGEKYEHIVHLHPERMDCEHAVLKQMMSSICFGLTHKRVISIVTGNTWLAQTIVDLMVRQGLSSFLHIGWWTDERSGEVPVHERMENVVHGWFPDQNTPVATEEFELAPRKLDYLDSLDFTKAMHAALVHS